MILCTSFPLGAEGHPALEVFAIHGCHDCEEFEETLWSRVLPMLVEAGVKPEIRMFDILEPEGYERLMTESTRLSWEFRGVPLLRVGNRFFYGDELAAPGLASAMLEALGEGQPTNQSHHTVEADASLVDERTPTLPGLSLWVVMGAGLVDGINPCALATLLFMISALTLGGRSRTTVATIGAGFIIGVFSAYFFMGLGLLKAGAVIAAMPWLRTGLRIVTALGLWILGILSLRDWQAVRRGRSADIALRLPDATIRRMHALIRKGAPVWISGFGAAGLGVLVSVSEFVCTGQIYLPTLVYISQSRTGRALGLLLAYNLAFILPLVPVFVLVIMGFSHARLTELFRKNLAAAKLGLAIFFLAFGALLLAGVAA
jgi:hypothetical protein